MPEPRIKLDNSKPVPAIPDAPIANAELPVMQVAVNAPAAPAASPPAPAPIVPPDFSAGQLNNPGPSYPYLSRKAKEQGVVLLRVLVSADGRAETLKVEKTSGFDRLDKAALATVKKWRFVPASQAGKPRQAWVLVPITFSLDR
ncbi:TonB family protein [Altererythrobacter indicus]|uniref:TonB family protein n=2 Tax=Altericroceibacterium indicum TaxID=374177 RepID=A0A845A6Q8_9SPHN|nr:TonB family protein [Altericroceibacterium indicum]